MKYISLKELFFMKPVNDNLEMATRAAWLSYVGGYTQSQVAKKLQVSTAKAHRLIALAREKHLVKIFIEGETAECVALEEKILQSFPLQTCTIAPYLGPDMSFQATGSAAARMVYNVIKDIEQQTIGIGKGRSLMAMVENLPRCADKNIRFVSVSGSLTRKLSANPQDVIHHMLERCGGEGYLLPVPYIARNLEEKDLMMAQQSVEQMLDMAKTSSLFIVGIGSLGEDAHIRETGMVDDNTLASLKSAGAIGDLMGSFIDPDGQAVHHPANGLSLGLGIEDLRDKKVIAIAGGDDKGSACLAALNTGVITDLILSEVSAKKLISLI